MWVLLLLGLLPLAVLPTMIGEGPQDGDATDDDDDDPERADDVWPDDATPDGAWWTGDGPAAHPVLPHAGDAGGADPVASDDGDDALSSPSDSADDPPLFQPATFVVAPGDGVASFAGFQPGVDRVEVHVDPEAAPPEVTSGQADGGSWVRVIKGEAVAEAWFADLPDPPAGDIHLVAGLLAPDLSDDAAGNGGGDGDGVPLAPVTDDADAPGAPPGDDGPVIQPTVPPEGTA